MKSETGARFNGMTRMYQKGVTSYFSTYKRKITGAGKLVCDSHFLFFFLRGARAQCGMFGPK